MIRLLEGDAERFADLGVVFADANRRLQLGLQHRQRGAELVAGVGHEPALALKRLLQAGEHLVQRLAEAADLVLRGRQRQPLAAALQGDPLRPLAHRLDRREAGGGEPVADPGCEQDRDRNADQERPDEARERLVAVRERDADDQDERASPGRQRAGEHPRRSLDARKLALEHGRVLRCPPGLLGAEHRSAYGPGSVHAASLRRQDLDEAVLRVGDPAAARPRRGVCRTDG